MGKRNLPFPGQPSSPEDPFTSESEPSQGKHPPVQVWNRKAQRFTSDMPARHDNTVWDQPFIDNGEASPTFKALLRIMFSWADEHLKPKDTTFMELPKLAELGQLGRLPDDCNIGLLQENQAAHVFSTLDIPHVFTSDSANRPRLALAPTGFDKWMTLLLLANKPQASKWIQNLAKEMGRRPGMSWPSQTPTHIPRQCFAADLLTQRQARYAYERAIQEVQRAMEEEDSDDEEDTPTNPQYHQYSQVEDDFYHPRTDGKGYYVSDSSVMPQQIQQQVIGPAGGGGIPVQQQPSGLPRWLEVYGGQNVGMFEPGRLQQGAPMHPHTNWLLSNGSAVPGSDWIQQMDTQRMVQQALGGMPGMMGGMMHPGMMGGMHSGMMGGMHPGMMGMMGGMMGGMHPGMMRRRGICC